MTNAQQNLQVIRAERQTQRHHSFCSVPDSFAAHPATTQRTHIHTTTTYFPHSLPGMGSSMNFRKVKTLKNNTLQTL